MTFTNDSSSFIDHPTVKNLGIWMDHSKAHLTEFITDPITTEIIFNKTGHGEKDHSPNGNVSVMDRQAQQQTEFYQKLGDIICKFQDVLLFGPTGAKVELLDLLKSDHRFQHIKLDIKETETMSQNRQHAFVRDHFSRR